MTESEATAPQPGLMSRFIGVLTSPRRTFEAVAARPRWFGMLALVLGISLVCSYAFLSTQVGMDALMERIGRGMAPQQAQQMQRMLPYMKYFVIVQLLVIAPLVSVVIAGILFGIFNAILGGDSTFKQVFAVVVHAGAITAVQQLFATPLNYVLESMSSRTTLAVFLPMLDEASFLAKLFGAIDLFWIWYVIVLAIGLGTLYKRKTGPIAAALFAVYGVIALAIAAFGSLRGSA